MPQTMRVRPPRPDTEEHKRVGIWIRVSTEDQAKGESPMHHEERARMYAEIKNWNVVTVYHLEAVSGKSVLGHPEAKRMLEDVRAGRISVLIFSKLARLARNTRQLIEISEIFRACDADLVSLQESLDTSTPGGRNLFRIMSSMAEWEREEIADRVAASVPIRAKLGKPLGGAGPFGYNWQDRKLVPHPEESAVRRLIYDLFLEHKRVKTVARLLNEAGHRTRSGTRFTDTTVRRLLRDPTAKGLRRANYTRSTGDKKHWVPKPEHEWVWLEIPAIVPSEVWEAANHLLDERQHRPSIRPSKRTVHPFAGYVFCGCGQKMYVPSKSVKYTCATCRTKIPIEDLEVVFRGRLREFALSPEEVAGHLAAGDRVIEEKRNLLASLDRERAKVAGEMEKVYQLYLAGQLSPEGFGTRNQPLEDRLHELDHEIPRLQGEVDYLAIEHLTSEDVTSGVEDLYDRWPSLASEEKRVLVETFVEKLTIGKEGISIALLYLPPIPPPPSSPELVANGQRGKGPAVSAASTYR